MVDFKLLGEEIAQHFNNGVAIKTTGRTTDIETFVQQVNDFLSALKTLNPDPPLPKIFVDTVGLSPGFLQLFKEGYESESKNQMSALFLKELNVDPNSPSISFFDSRNFFTRIKNFVRQQPSFMEISDWDPFSFFSIDNLPHDERIKNYLINILHLATIQEIFGSVTPSDKLRFPYYFKPLEKHFSDFFKNFKWKYDFEPTGIEDGLMSDFQFKLFSKLTPSEKPERPLLNLFREMIQSKFSHLNNRVGAIRNSLVQSFMVTSDYIFASLVRGSTNSPLINMFSYYKNDAGKRVVNFNVRELIIKDESLFTKYVKDLVDPNTFFTGVNFISFLKTKIILDPKSPDEVDKSDSLQLNVFTPLVYNAKSTDLSDFYWDEVQTVFRIIYHAELMTDADVIDNTSFYFAKDLFVMELLSPDSHIQKQIEQWYFTRGIISYPSKVELEFLNLDDFPPLFYAQIIEHQQNLLKDIFETFKIDSKSLLSKDWENLFDRELFRQDYHEITTIKVKTLLEAKMFEEIKPVFDYGPLNNAVKEINLIKLTSSTTTAAKILDQCRELERNIRNNLSTPSDIALLFTNIRSKLDAQSQLLIWLKHLELDITSITNNDLSMPSLYFDFFLLLMAYVSMNVEKTKDPSSTFAADVRFLNDVHASKLAKLSLKKNPSSPPEDITQFIPSVSSASSASTSTSSTTTTGPTIINPPIPVFVGGGGGGRRKMPSPRVSSVFKRKPVVSRRSRNRSRPRPRPRRSRPMRRSPNPRRSRR